MFLRNREGDVRLVWRLFLLVVPFLGAAYLLRYVPIRIQTEILIEEIGLIAVHSLGLLILVILFGWHYEGRSGGIT